MRGAYLRKKLFLTISYYFVRSTRGQAFIKKSFFYFFAHDVSMPYAGSTKQVAHPTCLETRVQTCRLIANDLRL